MRNKKQTEPKAATTAMRPGQHLLRNGRLKEFLFKKATDFHPVPGHRTTRDDTPTFGIISFAAGLIGLACALLIAASLGSVVVAAVGVSAAIAAIICGAMGLKRQMKGLAIIGMTLGILEILAGLVLVAIVLVFLSQW